MKRWIVPVTTISIIIGTVVSVQFKSQIDVRQLAPSRRVEDLVFMLKNTEKANKQLSEQVNDLQERLSKVQTGRPVLTEKTPPLYQALGGPGLEVTITENAADDKTGDGTSAVVHAEDLLKIVNELRSGGAEAVSLNQQRITETSEIITAGQHIVVNKAPIVPPYKIVAIGPAQDMQNTLSLRGGVVEYLQFYGIEVKAKASKSLKVPAANSLPDYRFAHPAQQSAGEAQAATLP